MKKILFFIHDLQGGGAEKVLVNLVNNMNQEEYDITVGSLFGGGINEQFLKPYIHRYNVFKKPFKGNSRLMKLLTPKQLHRLCVPDYYDIEVSFLEGPSARVISGCEKKNTRLISWIHVEQHSKQNVAGAFRSYLEAIQCYGRFDKTVCVSVFVKQDFMSLIPLSNPAIVIYNAIDVKAIRDAGQEALDVNCFNSNEFNIVGVGKIKQNKGFDRLARIHKRLIDDGLAVHCYILGTGPEEERIRRYLRENKLSESFTLMGYKLNPYKYVSNCDLFVCSSFAEGFSTAAAEALILGVPVCTVDVSGMKEMLGENDEYGVVTENDENKLYDRIRELINNRELLMHYKEKAQERGNQFNIKSAVSEVEELLDTI